MSENLASALVAALADLSVVEKGRTANAGSYSYSFADLADAVKLTRKPLADHGLVALTPVHGYGDDGLACTVIILHTSGERLDFEPFPFPHGETAQATGSMVTYHRRYALLAALGIAAGGDDDDGATAAPRARQQRPQARPAGAPSCALCEKPLAGSPAKKVDGAFVHVACVEGSPVGDSPSPTGEQDPGRPFEEVAS